MKEHLRQFIIANKELLSRISGEELEDIRRLMTSGVAVRVLAYFCKHTEGTARDVMEEKGIPEASVYNALVRLSRMGIINSDRKTPKPRRSPGGPRKTIWRLK